MFVWFVTSYHVSYPYHIARDVAVRVRCDSVRVQLDSVHVFRPRLDGLERIRLRMWMWMMTDDEFDLDVESRS